MMMKVQGYVYILQIIQQLDVAFSMKDSADNVGTYDNGNEYMCSESVVMAENGTTYVSFKDAIMLYKKMRSVHECTNIAVVENVVYRRDFWGIMVIGKKREYLVLNITMKMKMCEMMDFMTSREQMDDDGDLWNDDGN
eukprot:11238178-Ditylum_brightwellii.AAC.1